MLSLASASGCTTTQQTGTSPVQLVIVSLEGGPGDDVAGYRHTFESDVRTGGRVVEDGGRVLLALALKDPGTADLPSTTVAGKCRDGQPLSGPLPPC